MWLCATLRRGVCDTKTNTILVISVVRHINFRFNEEISPELTFRERGNLFVAYLHHLTWAESSNGLGWAGLAVVTSWAGKTLTTMRQRLINNWIRI